MRPVLFIVLTLFSIKIIGQDTLVENSIGMKFKMILPGNFIMGSFAPTVSSVGFFSQESEPDNDSIFEIAKIIAKRSFMPGFEVTIQKKYYIGLYEVSQKEWNKVMNSNPSIFNDTYLGVPTDDHPVENVSWRDCKKFISKLNKKDKGNFKYRLPSEIEWEFAARGGNVDDISWSEIWKSAVTGVQNPAKKGSKTCNNYGLYDMLGNVWEWVEDGYNEKIFADLYSSKRSDEHVIKGSCFYGDVKNATFMTHAGARGKRCDIGFRLILEKVN